MRFATCFLPIKARSASAGIPPARAPSARRTAFTLVELLVVIGIIAVLSALIVPAVMRAQASARNAAIKAEIDMLHMAIMNYKNEYGSFPPCAVATITGADSASRHLQRLFPRLSPANLAFQVRALPYMNAGSGTFTAASAITTDTALVAWLYGYNSDPQYPVLSTTGSASLVGGNIVVTGTVLSRSKLYDFDQSRISSFTYFPAGKSGSPYIYIDSANYLVSGTIPTFSHASGTYFGHRVPTSAAGTFNGLAQPAFNPDTFQILCAGRDEQFGTDDDLSNFWPGTRRDYLDSLNQ